jgi:hypothetical protein
MARSTLASNRTPIVCSRGISHKRRRIGVFGAFVALSAVIMIALAIVPSVDWSRLRDRGRDIPNPIRMVRDFLFPPPPIIG